MSKNMPTSMAEIPSPAVFHTQPSKFQEENKENLPI
jgi:hypothetical protein